jgi:hypothetical protein
MCVESQCLELRQKYPYLFLEKTSDAYIIRGTIFIEKDEIKDRYEIEIQIALDYPKKVPTVKETGAKIASNFHHNPDGTLCLEAPLAVYEVFRADETLLNYVDNLLTPYLYNHSYYTKNNKLPYGEHAHGAEGILADYKKRFGVSEDSVILGLLQILAEDAYRGHRLCPCGSQQKLRNCHGRHILNLINVQFNFMKDFIQILGWLKKEKQFDVSPYISKKVKNVIASLKSVPNEKWTY